MCTAKRTISGNGKSRKKNKICSEARNGGFRGAGRDLSVDRNFTINQDHNGDHDEKDHGHGDQTNCGVPGEEASVLIATVPGEDDG